MKISMIKTATVWDFPKFSTLNMPGFYNGITTAQIDTLAAETCAYMSQKHPDFSTLAARIAVSNLHKTHGKGGREDVQWDLVADVLFFAMILLLMVMMQ